MYLQVFGPYILRLISGLCYAIGIWSGWYKIQARVSIEILILYFTVVSVRRLNILIVSLILYFSVLKISGSLSSWDPWKSWIIIIRSAKSCYIPRFKKNSTWHFTCLYKRNTIFLYTNILLGVRYLPWFKNNITCHLICLYKWNTIFLHNAILLGVKYLPVNLPPAP